MNLMNRARIDKVMTNKQLDKNNPNETKGVNKVDVEVQPVPPVRRVFTSAYKRQVLEKADELLTQGIGKLGAYLRREGLYSSHLTVWRRQRNQGQLIDVKRGKAPSQKDNLQKENIRLKRALVSLEKRAKQAEFLVDLQKKIAELMATDQEIRSA
jgi:transposase